MPIIINEEGWIIAASEELLQTLGASTIYQVICLQKEGTIVLQREKGLILNDRGEPILKGTFTPFPSLYGLLQYGSFSPAESVFPTEEILAGEKEEEADLLGLLPVKEKIETSGHIETEEEQSVESPREGEMPEEEEQEQTDKPAPTIQASDETVTEEKTPSSTVATEEANDEEARLIELLLSEEEEPSPKPNETETPLPHDKPEESPKEEHLELLEEDSLEPIAKEEHPDEHLIGEEEEIIPLEEEPTENLSIMETPEEKARKEAAEKEAAWKELLGSFQLDLEGNAGKIDLDKEEYIELLQDFFEDSEALKEDLVSGESSRSDQAATILLDGTSLLQLKPLPTFFHTFLESPTEERSEMAEAFYTLLGKLKKEMLSPTPSTETPDLTVHPSEKIVEETEEQSSSEESEEPTAPSTEAPSAEETAIPAPPPSSAKLNESTETFLKDVQPVPLEFSLKIAAEELNLPEDLVLEFINDFAKQGHEYLPELIEAYQEKDLDRLQKTAHMLKGAASNLRIEAMVENLYELQFDNDIQRAPKRIKLFAGQLMSLDNYLEQMNS